MIKEVKKVLRYIYSAAKVTTIIGIIILLISMIMILIKMYQIQGTGEV